MLDLNTLLKLLIDSDGSDLHVKVGSAPHVRVASELKETDYPAPTPQDINELAAELLSRDDTRRAEFEKYHQVDVALSVPGTGRFRVHVSTQRGTACLTFRRVPLVVPTLDILGLPEGVNKLMEQSDSGLIVVAGPSSSGKTTTAAALLDYVNNNKKVSIVTIEDPIEIIHRDQKSIVAQKEVGIDVLGFASATSKVMREDPNVLYLSDIPDYETAQHALTAANTGQLVITTLRTHSASETITHLVEMFPPHQQPQTRRTLARCLRGIIAQKLLDRFDVEGRAVAAELMIANGRISERILNGKHEDFEDLIEEGEFQGMQTLDKHLLELISEGAVTFEEAKNAAHNPRDFEVDAQSRGFLDPPSPFPGGFGKEDDWEPSETH